MPIYHKVQKEYLRELLWEISDTTCTILRAGQHYLNKKSQIDIKHMIRVYKKWFRYFNFVLVREKKFPKESGAQDGSYRWGKKRNKEKIIIGRVIGSYKVQKVQLLNLMSMFLIPQGYNLWLKLNPSARGPWWRTHFIIILLWDNYGLSSCPYTTSS